MSSEETIQIQSATDTVDDIIASIDADLTRHGHPAPQVSPEAVDDLRDSIDKALPKGVPAKEESTYVLMIHTSIGVGETQDQALANPLGTNGVFFFNASTHEEALTLAQFHTPVGIVFKEDPDSLEWKEHDKMPGVYRLLRKDGTRDWDIVIAKVTVAQVADLIQEVVSPYASPDIGANNSEGE